MTRPRGSSCCCLAPRAWGDPARDPRDLCPQMRFMLLFSRQGKLRLQKWCVAAGERERRKMVRELMQVVLARKPKMCSFLEWRDLKVVYKR